MTTEDESTTAPPVKNGTVEVNLDLGNGYFALILTGGGNPGLVKGNATDGYHLEIDPGAAWDIVFTLDPRKNWEFADPGLTLKNAADAQYYSVICTPNRLMVNARSTQPAGIPKPWPEQIHPFSLHLKVQQSASAGYKLIVDPEFRNPPR